MEYQPWFRCFADLPERKAHYNDGQFRAYVELLCATTISRTPGTFPSLASVRRLVGDVAHFLTEQGDLVVELDGSVTVHGWSKYQRPFDRTHADRQARYRERQVAESDGSGDASRDSSSDDETVNRDIHAQRDASRDGHIVSSLQRHDVSSISSSTTVEEPTTTTTFSTQSPNGHYPVTDSDRDALDTYYELTRYRPWGEWSGDSLRAAITEYGNAAVDAALRVEHGAKVARGKLLPESLARLARDAEKARIGRPVKPKARVAPIDKAVYDAAYRELLVVTSTPEEQG